MKGSDSMQPDINAEISNMFSETQSVIDDEFKFKAKLGIGDEHFQYLNNAKNLIGFSESIAGGIGVGGVTAVAWYSTLGVGSKLLLGVGIASSPVGWFIGAATVGAAGIYGLKKFHEKTMGKAENELVTKVPKFLNTPLDLLGLSLANIILPPSIKIACSDGNFCESEKKKISDYFVKQWGFNSEFIGKLIQTQETTLDQFSYKEYAETLKQVCENTSEFKFDNLIDEILPLLNEIMIADGTVHHAEEQELAILKSHLI